MTTPPDARDALEAARKEERAFVLRCVERWLDCRSDAGRDHPRAPDVSHSALLGRLLSGLDPLPTPPPRRHSYPDYDLGTGERVRLMEAWAYRGEMWDKVDMADAAPGDHIVCDQARWDLVERRSGGVLRLRWPPTGDLYDLTTDGEPSSLSWGGLVWFLQRTRTPEEPHAE